MLNVLREKTKRNDSDCNPQKKGEQSASWDPHGGNRLSTDLQLQQYTVNLKLKDLHWNFLQEWELFLTVWLHVRAYLAVALWGGASNGLKVEYAPRLRLSLCRVWQLIYILAPVTQHPQHTHTHIHTAWLWVLVKTHSNLSVPLRLDKVLVGIHMTSGSN